MNNIYLPKEAALAIGQIIKQWKQKSVNIKARCFCDGKLTISVDQVDGKTFATITRKIPLIDHGRSYMLRREVNLPANFGLIWQMVYDILYINIYPFITRDPIAGLLEAKPEKKLTISDLTHEWLRLDYDGVSSAEENAFKWMYGPKEKYWRPQREFFAFVAAHDNIEKIALITAAQAVYYAMRCAGEDEETIRAYKKNFVIPEIKRHQ